MEPLSATLTFISLATTLSSLIDLAVNLRESFQKISRNRQDAKRLATDIVTNLQQLQEFYKEHSEVLDNSTSMKTAVCNLQREMHSVYSKCCSLTPNAGTKKVVQWHKVIIAFNSWVNRTKVAEEIKDLKTRVMLCYIQFTTFATARIEVSTQKIYDVSMKLENHLMWTNPSTILGLRKIEGDFSQTDIGSIDDHSLNLRERANTSNTYQRAGANAADTYLCSEIAIIDQTLTALSKTMIYPTKEKVGPYQKPFRPIIHIKPISTDPDTHRRDVIMKTLDVLQVLHNNNNNNLSHNHSLSLPFQQGGWGLVNLCIGLYQIGCYHEAILIGVWAVKLFRILADADADPNAYYPYLALSLHNLSHYYLADGNEKEAVDCVTECLEIGRILEKRDPTPEVRGLLVRSLVSSAKISAAAQDYERSFEESTEAVKVSEDILNRLLDRKPNDILSCVSPSTNDHDAIPQLQMSFSSSGVVSEEFNGVISQTLHGYGQALHQFSCSLHRHGRFLEAIAADTKALQVFRLIGLHNPSLFETDIVEILSSLTHKDFRVFIPNETSMEYIQESIAIYRRLSNSANGSDSNSRTYSKLLYDALYTQATMLRAMQRYTEELQVWDEVVDTGRSIQDFVLIANALYQKGWTFRHLHRFTDAAAARMEAVTAYRMAFKEAPNQLEANAHYELAVDLELADLPDEARVAAQEAVDQYRVLVLTGHESSTTTEALADSLTLLANISLRKLDFECAMEKGEEALRLYQVIRIRLRSHTPDPDCTDDITSKYADCLDINMSAAFESNDEERAVERGLLVVQLFEELSVHHTDADGVALDMGLVGSWETYGLLLNKHDRLAEARSWIAKALDWYKAHSASAASAVGDLHWQAGYIAALCIYGCILDDQGFPERALSQVETAVVLAKDRCLIDSNSNSNPSFVSLYCISTAHRIDYLLELGRYREALAISQDLVTYVRQGGLTDVRDVVECFLVHATTLNCNNEHKAALSISNEAIALLTSHTHSKSSVISMSQTQRDKDQVQLVYGLHVLSESLADCGSELEAEALAYARQSVDQIHELQARLPGLRSPRMRYVSALFSTNLACRLAASASASVAGSGDDYQPSINLLTEVKTFYETSVRNRNGYSIELARVNRLLGLLHCTQGQHEEGVAALAALTDLRKRLLEVMPDLARYVDVHLQHEERRPSLSWLKTLHSKLECSHHPTLSHLLR